ncbi:MAG: hypothetical protein U1E92_06730 [Moraxella osloensis]
MRVGFGKLSTPSSLTRRILSNFSSLPAGLPSQAGIGSHIQNIILYLESQTNLLGKAY